MKKLLFTIALILPAFLGIAQEVTIEDSKNKIMDTERSTSTAVKKSLLEVFVAAWDGWSVDGYYVMDTVANNNPNIIGITIHNGDSMYFPEGDTISNAYISAYPTGLIDRYDFQSDGTPKEFRGNWFARCAQRNATTAPVGVSIASQSYNSSTRALSVTVRADFVAALTEDLRFNLYIVEDSVSGTGTGYDQNNYLNSQNGHPAFNAGSSIVGYQHRKVVRAMLGGPWGTAGVIPAVVSNGSNYTQTYTYTLPIGYDAGQIYLVGLVQHYETALTNRYIHNAEEVRLDILSSVSKIKSQTTSNLKAYPNPFSYSTRVEFDLKNNANLQIGVYDILGQQVRILADGFMNVGRHSTQWYGDHANGAKAANGLYFIRFDVDGEISQKKVILNR